MPQSNCASATWCKDSRTIPECRHPSDPRATSSALIRVGAYLFAVKSRAAANRRHESSHEVLVSPMPCTSRGSLSPLRIREGRTPGGSNRIRGSRPGKTARGKKRITLCKSCQRGLLCCVALIKISPTRRPRELTGDDPT